MSLPTVETFMAKLASNKSEAIAFDNCRPDLTRRQHCQLVLSQVENSCGHIADSKRLADQRAINAKLKSDLKAAYEIVGKAKYFPSKAAVDAQFKRKQAAKTSTNQAPAKPSASIKPTKAIAPAPAKPTAAAPIKPQRELTGIARTAAAFAGTANRSTITTSSNLTGHARVSAFFATQARK